MKKYRILAIVVCTFIVLMTLFIKVIKMTATNTNSMFLPVLVAFVIFFLFAKKIKKKEMEADDGRTITLSIAIALISYLSIVFLSYFAVPVISMSIAINYQHLVCATKNAV